MRVVRLMITCALLMAAPAPAAEWLKFKNADFDSRLPVTIENPSDADDPGVVVSTTYLQLQETLPSATRRNVAVADENGKMIPMQNATDWLTFVVPVKAKETKTVYVYQSKERFNAPKPKALTSTDIREAWRSFENEFMGFRVEVGEKAKTTGLAIDIFGKTKQGHGARLQEIYASDYHKLQPWGIDVMKVSHGPGLGGIYLYLGDKMGRTDAKTTHFRVHYEGPLQSCVVAEGPATVDGKEFKVKRMINVTANDRTLYDTITVEGSPDALKDLKIGVGLRDLPDQKWTEKTSDGYAMVVGKGNQEGTEVLGLGVVFEAKDYVRTHDLKHETDGGHYYLITPHGDEGANWAHIHTRLAAFWNGDGWVNNSEQFETLLKQYAQLQKSPSKVRFAEAAEKR